MDDCFTRGRVFVRGSAAYRDQQRLAAAVTYKLHRNEISTEHFSRAVSYHTSAPARLLHFCTIHYYCIMKLYAIYLSNSEAIVAKSRNVSVQSSLLISTDMKK
ncbi:hypothetical protein T12_2165 [Trichinella patagoniensis]|uniref:Uncharacterized protein n=1 Tax=Trichinella patagoniensis TaxID=990121 RepID=A0A0V0Z6N6_9BILA|nr:hypothetical protein T12_2165 [Trichinella patagoniensis]